MSNQLFKDMTVDEAMTHWNAKKVMFLDVRTEEEYVRGHIPGATLIPIDDLERRMKELPHKDTEIIVYCAMGGRSAAVCDYLSRHHGYTRLSNVLGGFNVWKGEREMGKPTF